VRPRSARSPQRRGPAALAYTAELDQKEPTARTYAKTILELERWFGATLVISGGIGAAMTAIECGRALNRHTAMAQTSPATQIRPASTQPAQSRPRRRWIVASQRATRRTLIVAIDAAAELKGQTHVRNLRHASVSTRVTRHRLIPCPGGRESATELCELEAARVDFSDQAEKRRGAPRSTLSAARSFDECRLAAQAVGAASTPRRLSPLE
jgi:hypothetical protein